MCTYLVELWEFLTTPKESLILLAQILLTWVTYKYLGETKRIREQSTENLKQLEKQIKLQHRQYVNGIKPILSLYSKDDTPTSLGNPFVDCFIVANVTANPAIAISFIEKTISIKNGEQGILYSYAINKFPYIGGKESRPLCRLTTASDFADVRSRIGEQYGQKILDIIENSDCIVADKNIALTYYFVLSKDTEGNVHVTRHINERRIVNGCANIMPENGGYEHFMTYYGIQLEGPGFPTNP